jgi:pyruvate formate lyase activating enzyme
MTRDTPSDAGRKPQKVHALAEVLDQSVVAADDLAERLDDGAIRCVACAHLCKLRDGKRGICHVRYNAGGRLMVPTNYVAGVQVDPIEKKPFFHMKPGSDALTFGMLGCNFKCSYCQNWVTSQALREDDHGVRPSEVSADELIAIAKRRGASSVVSSYNEPLITAEWGRHIFGLAKDAGLMTGMVSNGNATPQVLDYLRPVTDAYKVDLKSFDETSYRRLGGMLDSVLNSIRGAHDRGFWVEVVTLLIPGFNTDDTEIRQMAEFLASVSPQIPWHLTAFHQDYKMTDPQNTQPEQLLRAREIGREVGLQYVYCGNLAGRLADSESTHCHNCGETLIPRRGYHVGKIALTASGACPACGTAIPGRW